MEGAKAGVPAGFRGWFPGLVRGPVAHAEGAFPEMCE